MKRLYFLALFVGLLLFLNNPLYSQGCAGTENSNETWIRNSFLELGVDLNRGGAITHVSKPGQPNMVNNSDNGRQIQPDYYQQPVKYVDPLNPRDTLVPHSSYTGHGYNTTYAGDAFHNETPTITHSNNGTTIYVKARPLIWTYNNKLSQTICETWYTVYDNRIHVKYRLTNERTDVHNTAMTSMAVPVIYLNGSYDRAFGYRGNAPYTNGPVSQIPLCYDKKNCTNDNSIVPHQSERWAILVNQNGDGLGFVSGISNVDIGFKVTETKQGGNECDNASIFIEPTAYPSYHPNTSFEYEADLIVGRIEDVRNYAVTRRCDMPQPRVVPSIPREADDYTLKLCAGQSVTLTAQGCNGQVLWTDNQTTPSITVSKLAPYRVTCIRNDGCRSISGLTDIVLKENCTNCPNPPSSPTISSSKLSLCSGETATLTASGCSGSVTWSNQQTGNSITVSATGTYTATCTVNGCASGNSNALTITTNSSCGGGSATCVGILPAVVAGQSMQITGDGTVRRRNTNPSNLAQTWKLDQPDGVHYRFTSQDGSGRVLGVANGGSSRNDAVTAQTWTGGDHQLWRRVDVGGGKYGFIRKGVNITWDLEGAGGGDLLHLFGDEAELSWATFRHWYLETRTCSSGARKAATTSVEKAGEWRLSPNPAGDQVTIETPHTLNERRLSVKLTAISGIEYQVSASAQKVENRHLRLNLNSLRLPAGLYIISISDDGELLTTLKMVKQ